MMKKRSALLVGLLTIILCSQGCFSDPNQSQKDREIVANEVEQYWVKLYKVNSRAIFYLNGEEIFDSGIQKQETEDQKIGLTDLLKSGKNKLKVEVLNGPPYDDSLGYDKYWDIDYELFNYKEPIDYIYEKNDKGRNGLVWTHEHIITIE